MIILILSGCYTNEYADEVRIVSQIKMEKVGEILGYDTWVELSNLNKGLITQSPSQRFLRV